MTFADLPEGTPVMMCPEVRADRRCRELQSAGHQTDYATVLADVLARDARDAGRSAAPMMAAPDALELDTSQMTVDEAVATAVSAIQAVRRG